MSIESRNAKVAECDKKWGTLKGLSEQEIKEFVEGNIHPATWWGEKQEKAARIVARQIGIESAAKKIGLNPEAEVLYACGVQRPPLIFNENNLSHYANWKSVNSKPPQEIAEEWILELHKKGNKYLEAISSHIRCEDFTNRFFITAFNEGTVHRADGKGGDEFDS